MANTDVLAFGAGIRRDDIWLRKVGNDLEVSVVGTGDKATLQSWYLGNAYHVEQFKTSRGEVLLDSKVQALVDAMAAFAPPPMGASGLSDLQRQALLPVMAANWGG